MPVTAPPALSATPSFPALADRAAGTYNSKAYNWATHMATTHDPEMVALAANVFANATDSAASATAAGAGAAAAAISQLAASASATAADASADAAAISAASVAASEAASAASASAAAASEAASAASASAAAASAASIAGGPVTSVNGETGIVTLSAADVGAQATLVSGTNIKTLNGASLLGSGDVSTGTAGLVLLATITPTVAANVDFLTTFTSTYDNYLILVNGVRPSVNDLLRMRVANAGTADVSSNYFQGTVSETLVNTAAAFFKVSSTLDVNGIGYSSAITIHNANATSGLKTMSVLGMGQGNSLGNYNGALYMGAYPVASAVSGVRFYWAGGSNFAAAGTIRVYGYIKA